MTLACRNHIDAHTIIQNKTDNNKHGPDDHDIGYILFLVVNPPPDKRIERTDNAQNSQEHPFFFKKFNKNKNK